MYEILVSLGVPRRAARELAAYTLLFPSAWFWFLDWSCESVCLHTAVDTDDGGDMDVEVESPIVAQGRRGCVAIEQGENGWYVRHDKTYESKAFHMVERGPDGVLRIKGCEISG